MVHWIFCKDSQHVSFFLYFFFFVPFLCNCSTFLVLIFNIYNTFTFQKNYYMFKKTFFLTYKFCSRKQINSCQISTWRLLNLTLVKQINSFFETGNTWPTFLTLVSQPFHILLSSHSHYSRGMEKTGSLTVDLSLVPCLLLLISMFSFCVSIMSMKNIFMTIHQEN